MGTAWEDFQGKMRTQMEKTYSKTTVDYLMNPKNLGRIPDADAHDSATGVNGDTMEIWLKVKGEIIEEATFGFTGCGVNAACGGMAIELAKGKTLGEALDISAEVIIQSLGGLPEEHRHCAELAAETMEKVVREMITEIKNDYRDE